MTDKVTQSIANGPTATTNLTRQNENRAARSFG